MRARRRDLVGRDRGARVAAAGRRGLRAAVELVQLRSPRRFEAGPGRGHAEPGFARAEQVADRARRGIEAQLLHDRGEEHRVRRRAREDRRPVLVDEACARPRVEPAASDDRDAHEVARVVHTPEPDMGSVTEREQRAVAPPAEPHRVHRAGVRPCPLLTVELRVTEGSRRACRARAREHLPAAGEPRRVVGRGVRAPRRVLGEILGHLLARRDREQVQVLDTTDVGRGDAEPVQLAAVERHAVVRVAHRDAQLLVLDGAQRVPRAGLERAAPVRVVVGGGGGAAVALQQRQPFRSRRLHPSPRVRGALIALQNHSTLRPNSRPGGNP